MTVNLVHDLHRPVVGIATHIGQVAARDGTMQTTKSLLRTAKNRRKKARKD